MKIKVCGMKYKQNIEQVGSLQPDFMGFIFYDKSKRNFEGLIPEIPNNIKKVGVFVNAQQNEVVKLVQQYELDAVQLHGDETARYCGELNEVLKNKVLVIKAFSVSDTFDFDQLNEYESKCDFFLFDTKGKERGGNGVLFDWSLLQEYRNDKPYFLSGGIGPNHVEELKYFLASESSKNCYAIDVNSRFESGPGMKKVMELEKFMESIKKMN